MPEQPKPCSKHPRYQGKREPIVPCKECQAIFDAKTNLIFDEHVEKIAKRDEARRELRGRQALLVLGILESCAHDIWGSADLHFDGDCFGEFEWCVVMRGGGFDQHREFAQGKTALEAVLNAYRVKTKGCRCKEHRKRMQQQLKHYENVAKELDAKLEAVG